jgi:aminopeptidase
MRTADLINTSDCSKTMMEYPSSPHFDSLAFEEKLDRLAQVAIQVGVNLRKGQELVVTAPIAAVPLVRRITEHAYKAGALLVSTFYSDDPSVLSRYRFASDESFDHAAVWMADAMASAFRSGAARLAVVGANPALLAGEDPSKISRASSAASKANKPAMELITKHAINWSIIAAATPEWAALVFPDDCTEVAVAKLWDAIFFSSRITGVNPVQAWKTHNANLQSRVETLNSKRYHSLRFRSHDGGTNMTVGLADDHLWGGGGANSGNGISCNPNIPTEECFTTPHKDRVDGTVKASKPLSHQGTLIENIVCRFENGRIVEATATAGQDVLNRLLDTDEGARSLGEVALVPNSSPISQSGVLFWNTLFDENAASHIALGQSYATCVVDGETKENAELAALGANSSLIHVDWMIGSSQIDVDGIFPNGTSEPLMCSGEWA